jgi:hypothetical protein
VNALEREIIEKFKQLQPAAKQRVRALIEQEAAAEAEQPDRSAFDYDSWLRDVEILRRQIRAARDERLPPFDVAAALRDIRDGEDE